MISEVLKKDNDALIELHKRMKPEKKLLAFLNHSRLIYQLYQAGKSFRIQHKQKHLSSK